MAHLSWTGIGGALRGVRGRLLVLLSLLLLLAAGENLRLLAMRDGVHGSFSEPAAINDPRAVLRYVPVHRAEEMEEVRRAVAPQAGITQADPALARLEKLFVYLLDRTRAARGLPSPRMASASPLEQFRLGERGEDRLWCANYAMVLALFLNAADVPARVVMVRTEDRGEALEHSFVEAWIPEHGGWVFTDPQSDKLWVRNADGRLLDSLSVFALLQAGRVADLDATVYADGALAVLPFAAVNGSERTYFTQQSFFEYRIAPRHLGFTPVERLRRWVLDERVYYALVDPAIPMARKEFALAALPVLLLAWLVTATLCLRGTPRRTAAA
ncbi:transglutaminase-like domain-containing protein [Arenibaculum pallidiluteum]|uniref:transglutaminase-like domain-containing protein n=1 Tax=Arenibaculum pallidiluteum TaxID=2812559 RepID=UPI001A963AC0|nr:transglutaminase-like domain-containing protein [Arenibaculum pallidiluteum]